MSALLQSKRAAAPRRWLLVCCCVGATTLGALSALLLFAPARWVAVWVAQATSDRVQLLDAQGTIWRGDAVFQLNAGQQALSATRLPGRVAWQQRLSGFGVTADLFLSCCQVKPARARVAPAWLGVEVGLSLSDTSIDASVLQGLGTPWNTLALGGTLRLLPSELQLHWGSQRKELSGAARLELLNTYSRLSTLKPVGSYDMRFDGGAVPTLQLRTLQGALQLQGSGQWVGARLRFQGQAVAAPEQEAALQNLLNIIGRRDGARSIISIG